MGEVISITKPVKKVREELGRVETARERMIRQAKEQLERSKEIAEQIRNGSYTG